MMISLTDKATQPGGGMPIADPVEVEQAAHDDLNANVNLQIGDADVSESNAVPVGLLRRSGTTTLTIDNGANLSDELDFTEHSMLIIHMPAAWTAASIGFQVAHTTGGTFQPLYDQLGNLVQIAGPPVASRDYQAPPEIAGCRFIKLWSQNGAGVNVNQGAARSVGVSIKA
jgi:hypothetical protein